MPASKNLIGLTFNNLKVLSKSGKTNTGKIKWKCRCICRTITYVSSGNLNSGAVKSCGCSLKGPRVDNPVSESPAFQLYNTLIMMERRCYDTRSSSYPRYGGRGIRICKRWRFGTSTKKNYECFFEDMGPKPTPAHSIERIDNNGNYTPNNCRWATPREQAANTSRNRWVTYRGKRMILAEAKRLSKCKLADGALVGRLNSGWSVKSALEIPKYSH